MLDLQTKSAIDSDNLQVKHQATHRHFKIGTGLNQIIQHIVGDGYPGFRNDPQTNRQIRFKYHIGLEPLDICFFKNYRQSTPRHGTG